MEMRTVPAPTSNPYVRTYVHISIKSPVPLGRPPPPPTIPNQTKTTASISSHYPQTLTLYHSPDFPLSQQASSPSLFSIFLSLQICISVAMMGGWVGDDMGVSRRCSGEDGWRIMWKGGWGHEVVVFWQ